MDSNAPPLATSPNLLATAIGQKILANGGSAIEAASAMAFALTVVYPHMCSLGGDAFWLIFSAKEKKLFGINASGHSGSKCSRASYLARGLHSIPHRGILACNTVPGLLRGIECALAINASFSTKPLPLSHLLSPSIRLACDGYPVSCAYARWNRIYLENARRDPKEFPLAPEFAKIYFKDQSPYEEGECFVQSDLAQSLEMLAHEGLSSFYTGRLAEKMFADLSTQDFLLTEDDFANEAATLVAPISVPYRAYTAYALPPNSQGFAALEILHILNQLPVTSLREGSAEYYHVLIEATKKAFMDRDRYLSDPDFVDIPLERLLSKSHAQELAANIKEKAASFAPPLSMGGDTVWLGALDQEGNAVSLIQSVYYDFGAAVVPKGTGILLQNRGTFFSLDPLHPNTLEPKKRTFHTLTPAMLFFKDRPYLIYGTMGGEGQPQTQAMLVTRILDFGMSPKEALARPRFLYGRAWGEEQNGCALEASIPEAVVAKLKEYGHTIRMVPDFSDCMGHAGAILVDYAKKRFLAAHDPRGDGAEK